MNHRITRVAPLLLLLLLLAACQRGEQPTPSENAPASEATVASPEGQPAEGSEPGGQATGASEGEPATPAATETPAPSPTPADPLASVDPSGQQLTLRHPFVGERAATLEAAVNRFNETNEQKISIELQASEETGSDEESTAASLYLAGAAEIAALQEAGALAALTPYLESSTWGLTAEEQGMLMQPLLDAGQSAEGERVSWPIAQTATVLYYNADLLQELGFDGPPSTWEELSEMACAASEAGNSGFQPEYALDETDSSIFIAALLSRGGTLTADGAADAPFDLTTEQALDTVSFFQGMYEEGCLVSGPTQGGAARDFGTGTLLFTSDSTGELPLYQQAVEAGYGGTWGIAPLPHEGAEPMLLLGGQSAALAQGTPEAQLAGWLLLKWLSEPQQQAVWSNKFGVLPVRSDVETVLAGQMAESIDGNTLAELLASSIIVPPIAADAVLPLLLDDGMAQIIEGANAEETLVDLTDEANALTSSEP